MTGNDSSALSSLAFAALVGSEHFGWAGRSAEE